MCFKEFANAGGDFQRKKCYKTNTPLLNLLKHHVAETCKALPKALRPRKKRVQYTVGDAFSIVLELKRFVHCFGGSRDVAVRKFLSKKKMDKRALQRLCQKVALYTEHPVPRGEKLKRKRSVCKGSGRKPSVMTDKMDH